MAARTAAQYSNARDPRWLDPALTANEANATTINVQILEIWQTKGHAGRCSAPAHARKPPESRWVKTTMRVLLPV